MKRIAVAAVVIALIVNHSASPVRAAIDDEQVQAGIKKLVALLYQSQNNDGHWDGPPPANPNDHAGSAYGGATALNVYALLTAGESYQNPKLNKAIEWLKKVEMTGVYARGTRAHVWSHLPPQFDQYLQKDLYWLQEAAHKVGTGGVSWRYTKDSRDWDNSAAQYGLLGVWEAAKRGHSIGNDFWKGVEDHFLATQAADGGWSYTEGDSYGSMSAAGLTCLFVTQDYLHARDYSNPGATRKDPLQARIDKGLEWFGKNFSTNNPGKAGAWVHYYLYGVERVGLASGYKYFNNQDWYLTGAEFLLRNHGQKHDAAFSLLFLVRGRVPVLINKLQIPDYDWNNRPRDLAKLTSWVSDEVEKDMNWQIVSIAQSPEQWLDAPLLYIASHEPLTLTEAQAGKIKRFIDMGGMLITSSDRSNPQFTRSVQELMKTLYPGYKYEALDPDDELNNVVFKLGTNRLGALTLSNGIRHLAIHLPRGDVSWTLHSANHSDPGVWELFVNAYYYATEKGRMRPRLADHYIPRLSTGAGAPVTVARASYEGNWDPEPGAWQTQSNWMFNQKKADVKITNVPLDNLADAGPFVHVTGTGAVEFTDAQIESVKKHVAGGGVILFENAGGSGEFAKAIMAMLRKAYPSERMRPISLSSPIVSGKGVGGYDATKVDYRAYALLRMGQVDTTRLLSLTFDGEPRILLSGEDLTEAMLDQPVWGVFGYSTPSAQQLMTNILLWANKQGGKIAATN